MTTLALVAGLAHAHEVGEHGASKDQAHTLSWDWSQPHRFALETRVRLPEMMQLGTRFNRNVRIDTWELRLVTQCAPGEKQTRKSWEVLCKIEDLSISAEALPQESGIMQEVVEEVDRLLTGSAIQLQVHRDGRLLNVDLEQVGRRNRRFGRINENLRLITSLAFAGLDMPLPRRGRDDQWVQNSSWIMRAPDATGSAGTSQLVHKVASVDAASIDITSGGKGVIVPGSSPNQYITRMVSQASFDPHHQRLQDRTWTLIGGPTPSSAIAQGTEGYPYVVEGRLVALSEGQSWDVGESRELPRSEPGQTAIQQSFLGTRPW